jgi:membrane glycosyltransferase
MTMAANPHSFAMPPLAPLQMPIQDLGRPHPRASERTSGTLRSVWILRAFVFLPAIATTAALIFAVGGWLSTGGMTVLEWIVLGLIAATFFWVALSLSTATLGIYSVLRQARSVSLLAQPVAPMSVALLVPIYNENPSNVFGNAAAMLADLDDLPHPERFTLFILSDTQDPAIAEMELQAFATLRLEAPTAIPVYYRRRSLNIDRKTGNLGDWIANWGAAHEAMLVLDADSLMSGEAILNLADELARDPEAGLIQSCPRLIGAVSLFARVQQFSNVAYGWLLSEGLARWSQQEANYWGHNAIMRTHAFAASAGLPHLVGLRGTKSLILSHDFVEAGLLRRAGWTVRFLAQTDGSFEETPPTLVDYVLRDRRWCQGNMQHLRLLATRGFHPISRFHLFHGAASYLLSPAWFALLAIWALLGRSSETNVLSYFNATNPLFPDWPEMSQWDSLIFLLFMYSMLLAPKVMGTVAIAISPKLRAIYGGNLQFLTAFCFEVVVSIAYAPILMVQQTLAVLRSILGLRVSWTPQQRQGGTYGFTHLLKFHALESVVGILLVTGIVGGLITLWLIPIAASLICALPLSMLSGIDLSKYARGGFRLETPQSLSEPRIVTRARSERQRLQILLDPLQSQKLPAE